MHAVAAAKVRKESWRKQLQTVWWRFYNTTPLPAKGLEMAFNMVGPTRRREAEWKWVGRRCTGGVIKALCLSQLQWVVLVWSPAG